MKKSQIALILIIGLAIGAVAGYVAYSQLTARYVATSTACVMMNQAVENKILTTEQVKELGVLTGKELKKNYESVADKFSLPKENLDAASPESNCSQFIVGVNQAQ